MRKHELCLGSEPSADCTPGRQGAMNADGNVDGHVVSFRSIRIY